MASYLINMPPKTLLKYQPNKMKRASMLNKYVSIDGSIQKFVRSVIKGQIHALFTAVSRTL